MLRGHPSRLRAAVVLFVAAFGLVSCQSAPEPAETTARPARTGHVSPPAGWRELEALARGAGYRISGSHVSDKHTLTRGTSRIEVDAASRVTYFDGELVVSDAAPRKSAGRVWVSPATARRITSWSPRPKKPVVAQTPTPVARPLQGIKVVIDPGHGGKDPGAHRGVSTEKAINLGVGKALARLLRDHGAEVVLTRSTDRFISLDERAFISNREAPDAFISLHVNAAAATGARGIEIYRAMHRGGGHRKDKLAASSRLANAVYSRLQQVSPARDRGVKPSPGWRVLKKNAHPAILVEMGFISNRAERRLLDDGAYREKLARAIAEGVVDFAGPSLSGPTARR